MAFHLKLLAKFSLTENHLLNYSCYILQKGFEIVISYNHIIDFRQLIKIIRNYVSFDILIVRVLQLDISRIIIFIIYSHFKWTSFQIIQILIQTFLFLYPRRRTQSNRYWRTRFSPLQIRNRFTPIAARSQKVTMDERERETSDRPSSWGERGLSLVEGKRARARQERCRNDR